MKWYSNDNLLFLIFRNVLATSIVFGIAKFFDFNESIYIIILLLFIVLTMFHISTYFNNKKHKLNGQSHLK